MYVLLMLSLLGSALAASFDPVFWVTFDNPGPASIEDDVGNISFKKNVGGTITQADGMLDSALVFDGNTYFTAEDSEVGLSCVSDLDQCLKKNGGTGITVSLWARPDLPFSGDEIQWFFGFGYSPEHGFGCRIGHRRDYFIFEYEGREQSNRIACKITDDMHKRKDENGDPNWAHITLKKRPSPGAQIYGTVNGFAVRQDDVDTNNVGLECDTQVVKYPAGQQAPLVSKQMVIGASYILGDCGGSITGFYQGQLDDIRVYPKNLKIKQLRAIYNEGISSSKH